MRAQLAPRHLRHAFRVAWNVLRFIASVVLRDMFLGSAPDVGRRTGPAIGARRGARASGVVHVVPSLDPGGTERLVIQLARELAQQYRPFVCCLDHPGEWASELAGAGIEVVALGRRPGFRPSVGWELSKVVARHEARILHCHHYSPFVYGAIAMACSRGLRVVYTEHGRLSDAPPTRKRRLVNPCLGLVPDQIYAVSHDLRRHMIAEGLPPARIGVIHNGIEPGPMTTMAARRRARARLGIPEMSLVIGTLARLDPVKDLQTTIHAFATLRQSWSAARLVVVGDGPQRDELIDMARAAGVADHVMFEGYRSDARELLAAFDVYVNTSISEGVSLTLLEAMAASLPIIATSVGGTPEVVVHGDTGRLIPARDPDALAQELSHLAESPNLCAAYGAAGRRRVEAAFTLDRMVKDYARVYALLDVQGAH